jgi:hypothetical protein
MNPVAATLQLQKPLTTKSLAAVLNAQAPSSPQLVSPLDEQAASYLHTYHRAISYPICMPKTTGAGIASTVTTAAYDAQQAAGNTMPTWVRNQRREG